MANPLYGQNKADGNIGWVQKSSIKAHGTLGSNLVLAAEDMVNSCAHTCDPAAARNITTPTAALIVAAMKVKASDGKCVSGEGLQILKTPLLLTMLLAWVLHYGEFMLQMQNQKVKQSL